MKDSQLTLFSLENFWFNLPFVALDVETTGLSPLTERVIELALVPFNLPNTNTFCELFNIERPLPSIITQITGINDEMLIGKPKIEEKFQEIFELFKKAKFIAAYNVKFDKPFMEAECKRFGFTLPDIPWIDPFVFVSFFDRFKKGKKLQDAAKRWGIELNEAHRALADAKACGELLLKMAPTIGNMSLDGIIVKQAQTRSNNEEHRNNYLNSK